MKKLFFKNSPFYFYDIPNYFSAVQLFHNLTVQGFGLNFISCARGEAPGAKLVWWFGIGSSAWLCRRVPHGTCCLLATVDCSSGCVPSDAVRL